MNTDNIPVYGNNAVYIHVRRHLYSYFILFEIVCNYSNKL